MTCCSLALRKDRAPAEWFAGQRDEEAGVRSLRPAIKRATAIIERDIVSIEGVLAGNPFLDVLAMMETLPWLAYENEIINSWVIAAERVARRSATRAAEDLGILEKVTPGDINRFARAAAEKNALTLAETTSIGSQRGLRLVIQDAVANNLTPKQLAKRARFMIGNTERDSKFLLRTAKRMEERGVPASRVNAWMKRESKKKIAARADRIARTEINEARNAGTQAAWENAIGKGQLNVDVRKVWISNAGCKICEAIVAQGPIRVKDGWFHPLGGGISHPPAHPNCRCSHGLVFIND